MKKENRTDYSDLYDLPHPTSAKHPRMPIGDRAAQFAPFAALTGYEDAIDETARLTDREALLTEDRREELDRRQQMLLQVIDRRPEITVTYFLDDARKAGGAYRTVTGHLLRLDTVEGRIYLTEGKSIPFARIFSIDSPLFSVAEEERASDGGEMRQGY